MLTVCILAAAIALQSSQAIEPKQPIVENGSRPEIGNQAKQPEDHKTTSPDAVDHLASEQETQSEQSQSPAQPNQPVYRVEIVAQPELLRDGWFYFFNLSTAALALAGFGTLWFLWKQTEATRKAAEAAERGANASHDGVIVAKESADAANLTAQALINSERAWVEIEFEPCWDGETTDSFGGPDTKFRRFDGFYALKVSNCGRTMAKIIGYAVRGDCIPKDETISPHVYPPETSISRGVYVPLAAGSEPHELASIGPIRDFLPDIPGIGKGEKKGVVSVGITYRDIVMAGTEGAKDRVENALFMYSVATGLLERLIGHDIQQAKK